MSKKTSKNEKSSNAPSRRGVPDSFSGNVLNYFREKVVYKFFWGRGSLYKTTLHASIAIVTFAILISGVSGSFQNSVNSSSFSSSTLGLGNVDLLEQGASVEPLLKTDRIRNFEVNVHTVADGESLDDIANKYLVAKRGIIDSNREKIDFYSEELNPGDKLRIPPVDGVLYKVEAGDTVDSILEKVEGGNRYDIIELNNLRQPDFEVRAGQELIIVSAQLPAPEKPQPEIIYTPPTITLATSNPGAGTVAYGSQQLNGVSFSSPVSHPSCAGWGWSRGFTGPYYLGLHDGIDISKAGGCVLVATGSGLVNFAGWSNGGQGFMVKISHGNGLETQYFHGSGEFYVRAGEYVEAGQPIMYMGSSGLSFGTHLHYSLFLNGMAIDPAPYTRIF